MSIPDAVVAMRARTTSHTWALCAVWWRAAATWPSCDTPRQLRCPQAGGASGGPGICCLMTYSCCVPMVRFRSWSDVTRCLSMTTTGLATTLSCFRVVGYPTLVDIEAKPKISPPHQEDCESATQPLKIIHLAQQF